MFYLAGIWFLQFDFSFILPKSDTVMVMIITIVAEIICFLSVHVNIYSKPTTSFHWSLTKEKDEEFVYNKKNFFSKWFLVGTKGKVSLLTRIFATIKNVGIITYLVFAVLHLILFNNTLSLVLRLGFPCPIFLSLLTAVLHSITRKKEKK